ncbi:MAG: hypothetical protein WC445_04965 [Patescibacteria group bacterium]
MENNRNLTISDKLQLVHEFLTDKFIGDWLGISGNQVYAYRIGRCQPKKLATEKINLLYKEAYSFLQNIGYFNGQK